MRRILLTVLWIAVLLFAVQIVYFVFFSTKPLKYNEGAPLAAVRVPVDVKNVSCLTNDGDIWIGTNGNGIYRYDVIGSNAKPVEVPDELKKADIRSLAADRYGRLWVGTARSGLFVRNGSEWKHVGSTERIPAIRVSPVDGAVALATNFGVVVYNAETDTWTEFGPTIVQPTSLAFDAKGNLFAGTSCHGIFVLKRSDTGNFSVGKQIPAPRRYGPGSASNVSPVPLDSCGEGLPSNQINALLVGSDGTVWAGTSAGLAWSRNNGETWTFLRGRDYGDKMRGLFAGTPHGWKELPRIRFGELLPEDHVSLLTEDEAGTLWVGTSSLGCVALKPSSLYQTTLPKNDDPASQQNFLTEIAAESSRFHGTKADRIVGMTPLSGTKILVAPSSGSFETMECPGVQQEIKPSSKPERTSPKQAFPTSYVTKSVDKTSEKAEYPNVVFLGEDRTTSQNWSGKYGKTYALIGGGEMPHDKLIAFDETVCKVRSFVGNVGNRTRPLERVALSHVHHHHDDNSREEQATNGSESLQRSGSSQSPDGRSLTAWSSTGSTVPRTADGQHLWCEIKLNQPGRHELSLCFADPVVENDRVKEVRDFLIEIFPEMPTPKVRIPKNDWQELGKRFDEWATQTEPLVRCRVADFRDGIYERFALTGPGTYMVKIDKNYGRKVDLCAVLIDKTDAADLPEPPIMSSDQSSDNIP